MDKIPINMLKIAEDIPSFFFEKPKRFTFLMLMSIKIQLNIANEE